jgi:uncharacterized protein YgfB (UPF0149 family)
MKFQTPYQLVDEIAPYSEANGSAAELHGVLTGMLCVDGRVSCEQWVSQAFGEGEADLHDGQLQLLRELCDETRQLLIAEDYSFDLFLPDEEADLMQRGEALGEWCQGFLLGIGYAVGDGEWPGECKEILQDIMQISQLDAEGGSEEDLSELNEFVRVSVQILRGEFQHQAQKNRLH